MRCEIGVPTTRRNVGTTAAGRTGEVFDGDDAGGGDDGGDDGDDDDWPKLGVNSGGI